MKYNSANSSHERMDLVLIGHFAIDTIVIRDRNSENHSLGGGVTYGSLAASTYLSDKKIGVVSRCGKDFNKDLLNIFNGHQINLSRIIFNGDHTTKYLLEYYNGSRDLSLLSKATNIEISDIPPEYLSAHAIHLTPIADEFSSGFLKALANHRLTKDTIFGIDIQGVIRTFDEEGHILMKNDEKTRQEIMNFLNRYGKRMLFKASDKEAQAVSGEEDLIKATEKLGSTGVYVFTTLGPKGLYFKAPGKEVVHLNAYKPSKKADETGAGDCFMATLLLEIGQMDPEERTYENVLEKIKYASASSSFLVEKKGPNGFRSKEEIIERIKKNELLE